MPRAPSRSGARPPPPMNPPNEFTRRPTPHKAQPAASEALRGILWESVTYLPALPARKRRQLIDDGSNTVFGGKDAIIAPIESEMGQKETSSRPFKSRDVSAPCVR